VDASAAVPEPLRASDKVASAKTPTKLEAAAVSETASTVVFADDRELFRTGLADAFPIHRAVPQEAPAPKNARPEAGHGKWS
jgi:hypothetical protein